MGKQMADGNGPVSRNDILDRTIGNFLHFHIGKGRQYFRQWLIEAELAFINQHHGGHAGNRLGHGIDTVQAINPGRRCLAYGQRAFRDDFRILLAPAHGRDHIGNLAAGPILIDHCGNVFPCRGGGCLVGKCHTARRHSCQRSARTQPGTAAQQCTA